MEEQEYEIEKLKRANAEEKEILLQFEQEYHKSKEEFKRYEEEIRKLKIDN